MQHTTRQSRLISTVLLGSLITLGSASSFAADGSDRLRLKADAIATGKLQRLAENGSERLLQRQQRSNTPKPVRLAEDGSERSRVFWLQHHLDVAEGGAERLLASRKA